MEAEELDREWSAWLEARKRPAPPDPEFTRRVMAAVRAEARAAADGGAYGARAEDGAHPIAPEPARPTRWTRPTGRDRAAGPGWFGWIMAILSPRPALAFATLALASVLAIRYVPHGSEADGEGTRIKGGGFRVGYLLKRGDRIVPAASGEGFLPGDRLQAVYSSDREGYIRFFSIDAAGRIESLSRSGTDSVSPAGQDKTFPFALELDGDPADEALIGIWTPRPADAAALEAGLREAWDRSRGDLPGLGRTLARRAPPGSRVSFFLLHKKADL